MTNPNILIVTIPELKDLPYLNFVWVEGGKDIVLEGYNYGDEHKLQKRELSSIEGFWIGAYPVSQAFWEAVMGENPSKFKDPNRPVEKVSWDDIRDEQAGFLKRLNVLYDQFKPKSGGFFEHVKEFKEGENGKAGGSFRLPSEAEWEYAARGGKYWEEGYAYSGSDYLNSTGYYTKNTRDEGSEPLGLKLPNALGLYDMSGNVWEWCEDDWPYNYWNAPKTGEAWIDSPNRGDFRVNRGGSWSYIRRSARVAIRNRFNPDHRGLSRGCRLVFA